MKSTLHFILIITLIAMFSFQADAQKKEGDIIWDEWYTEDNESVIKIFRAKNGKYYGKIVWLDEPNENGKPKVDDENPDPDKRNRPLMGLLILRSFEYDGDHEWSGGTIYDPENGKTYKCTIKLEGKDKLDVRGYIGVKALGRTTTWIRKK